MGRDQQPVAPVLLHPEHLRVPEVVPGIALGAEEGVLRVLFPVHPVRARGVHDALLAHAAVASVVMPGVEQVVEPLPIPQH